MKRGIALLMASAMAISVCGCGASSTTTGTTASGTTSAETASAEITEATENAAVETTAAEQEGDVSVNNEDTRTFEINPDIEMRKVSFQNRFGIQVVGDLYLPVNYDAQKNAAIVVSGPFGAVKEQASGLYAQQFAAMGFVALAFDPSYTGESGGEVRNVASPEMFTEDYSAAVDYLGIQDFVDRELIGAMGICGLSGMALTAASSDTRIKAVATASMYDMSRSISRGYQDSYTDEQRRQIMDFLSRQRWEDAENGSYATGPHELAFKEDGELDINPGGFPEELPEDADSVTSAFFNYYVKRAYHPNSVNSATAWTQTTPISFFNFPLMDNIQAISPRPIMLVAGENAHSRYYSEDVYEAAAEPKELVIVPDADHVDLYDNMSKIPFDQLAEFFNTNLQ